MGRPKKTEEPDVEGNAYRSFFLSLYRNVLNNYKVMANKCLDWLYNPFAKTTGVAAATLGAIIAGLTVWIECEYNVFFSGFFKGAWQSFDASLWQCFSLQAMLVLIMTALIYCVLWVFREWARPIDLAGGVMLAGLPWLLLAVLQALAVSVDTLGLQSILFVARYPLTIWYFALLYYLLKAYSGVTGWRNVALWVVVIIVTKIVTNTLTRMFFE
jgi:hypothetical protein